MRVSAVIPVHNRRHLVQRAVDSVLAQRPAPDEVIVVDDGSTDGTAIQLAATYGSAIRVVTQANGGVSVARRRGVEEARGDWIAFLDSDDEWIEGRQAQLLEVADRFPEAGWVFGDTEFIYDGDVNETAFRRHGMAVEAAGMVPDALSVQHPYMFCLLQSSIIRRDALRTLGCFAQGLRSSEDVLAAFQAALKYRFAVTPEVVTRVNHTRDLAASSLEKQGRWGVDYYRARMLAYRLAADSGRREPWAQLYVDAVRGYCQARATGGNWVGLDACRQFRYGASAHAVAFALLAFGGAPGLRVWRWIKQTFGARPGFEVTPRITRLAAVESNGTAGVVESVPRGARDR